LALGPPSFELVYNQLVLAALRSFPLLLGVHPKIERGKRGPARVDKACRALFYRRASLLGLRNELIDQGVSEPAQPFTYGEHDPGQGFNLNQVDRRWGKPCARLLQQIQRVGFLPHLAKCPLASDEISVSFLLKDFTQTFLVYSEVSLDSYRQTVFLNVPHNTMSLFPQSNLGYTGAPDRPILGQDVDMNDAWSEDEDVIMQDYVPMAADITSHEPAGRALASSVQKTSETQSKSNRQVALRSKAFSGQPIRRSPHVTNSPISFRPRYARDQIMRRLIVDKHVRSIAPSHRSISPLQDRSPVQKEPDSEPPLRSGDVNAWQQLGVTLSQTALHDSMDGSMGYARSTIPTLAPSSQISVFQHLGSVTPSPGLLEDREAPSFSAASSDRYSRSIIPSPPQYTSCETSLSRFPREPSFPTGPPRLNTASPSQQQPRMADTHDSSISTHIRPRSTLPTPSVYSPQSIVPSLSRSEIGLHRDSDRAILTPNDSQNAPEMSPSTTNSIEPRSTCPTPPIFQRGRHTEEENAYPVYRLRDRYTSGWQGFDDSDDDDLVSIDLN
jgi:hypothetical protein